MATILMSIILIIISISSVIYFHIHDKKNEEYND